MNYSNVSVSNGIDLNVQFCYESVRGSCRRTVRPVFVQAFIFIFLCLAILITIAGNLLVIAAVAHFKQLHTTTNCLILSLAVCDFLLGVFIMPCNAVSLVQGCWFLGDFVCKLHTSTAIMLTACSIYHLSFISIDRYIAICTPLLYQSINNSLTTLLMVTTSWLTSAIFAYGMIFSGWNLKGSEIFYETYVRCVGGCILFFTQVCFIVSTLTTFFIPGFIIVGLYTKIYTVARHQAKSIKDQTKQVQVENRNLSKASGKNEKRKENSLALVVVVFFICWTPFFFCTIINSFTGFKTPPVITDVFGWFGYLNSSFNPFLYAFFYSWFRKAFRIILSGRVFQSDSCRMKVYSE